MCVCGSVAPDIVCAFPTAPGGPQEISGRETNRTFYTSAIFPMWSRFSLVALEVHALADIPERIVAKFESDGSLIDGSPYQNRYLCLATVRDGKIQHWAEYSDPAPIERGLKVLQAARDQ